MIRKKLSAGLFIVILFTSVLNLNAQDLKIKTNSLSIINDKLVISYEFTEFEKNQKFEVWVIVTDGYGNKIVAKTFSGDVGPKVLGGKDKKIEWDYMYDNIVINDEIGIEVKARKMTEDELDILEMTVPKTALQSAVFPGWGLTKATKKKSFLFLGAATYISAGLGVYYNLESQKNYESYQSGGVLSSESEFYQKSVDQKSMSNVLFYSAAGIWTVTMVWTIIKTKKIKDAQKTDDVLSRAIIFPTYDPHTNFKGISIVYRF